MKHTLSSNFDNDANEVVIRLDAGDIGFSTRLCPQDAWLLLYLLNPEWDGWSDQDKHVCERLLAAHPTLGVAIDSSTLFVQVPSGYLKIPVTQEAELVTSLVETLSQLPARIADQSLQQHNEREERLMFADNHLSCTFKLCRLAMERGHLSLTLIREVFRTGVGLAQSLYTNYCGLSIEKTKERAENLMRFLLSIDPTNDKLTWLIEPDSMN